MINTHYLAAQVNSFVQENSFDGLNIKLSHEVEILGTAGTLIKHKDFFEDSTGLMIHADNATKIELNELIKAHNNRPNSCIVTMLTFTTKSPSTCGIVERDQRGVVTSFHEKTSNPPGNIANGAVYMFDSRLFEHIKMLGGNINDFSVEVLPTLVGKIYTWHTDAPFIDIGTYKNLKEARSAWRKTNKTEK